MIMFTNNNTSESGFMYDGEFYQQTEENFTITVDFNFPCSWASFRKERGFNVRNDKLIYLNFIIKQDLYLL